MKAPYSNRKYVINIIILSIGVIFIIRLFFIQIIDDSYKISADRNVLRVLPQFPARGLIYVIPDALGRRLVVLAQPDGSTRVLLEETCVLGKGVVDVEPAGQTACAYCMPFENNAPILIVRGLRVPVQQAWPGVKHYD